MRRLRLLSISILIILLFLIIFEFTTKKYNYMVLATDYVENETNLYKFKNKSRISMKSFPIGGAESVDIENGFLLFDKFGTEVLTVKNKVMNQQQVKHNPLQIENYENEQIILHNEGINSFSITKNDGNFNNTKESDTFDGFARNFIIFNNTLYVLANVYDEQSNRTVGIYKIDIKTLEINTFTVLNEMTFGFHMSKIGDTFEVYGNSNEEKQDLTIYKYNPTSSQASLYIKSDIKAMWVNKSFEHKDSKIIVNNYSILSIDKKDKVSTVFENGKTLIDLEYNSKVNQYYLLYGDFEKKEYYITTMNENFKVIDNFPLDFKDKTPTDLIIGK